jgi:hypothetical protein
LVFNIVDELTWADIPCLTVHDSNIVQKKRQGLVKLLMDSTTFPDPDLVGWVGGWIWVSSTIHADKIQYNTEIFMRMLVKRIRFNLRIQLNYIRNLSAANSARLRAILKGQE